MSYSEEVKRAVWQRAKVISGKDPLRFRKDVDGNEIRWEQYKNKSSAFGWEIHKIGDVSGGAGGSPPPSFCAELENQRQLREGCRRRLA